MAARNSSTTKPETENSTEPSTDIAQSQFFTREQYAGIENFDQAIALAEAEFGTVVIASDDPLLGTGFKKTTDEDKDRLVGVPLLLLDWRFNSGDYGDKEYVSIHAVSSVDGKAQKWILNDGGSGIYRDLKEYTTKTGRQGGLAVRKGLRSSTYPTNPEKDGLPGVKPGAPLSRDQEMTLLSQGKRPGKGKTFYLDFSA